MRRCVEPSFVTLQCPPHLPLLTPECAALKERIGRLLAAVLPVATSGKERGSDGGNNNRGTTISIRSRPVEERQEANGKQDGEAV